MTLSRRFAAPRSTTIAAAVALASPPACWPAATSPARAARPTPRRRPPRRC